MTETRQILDSLSRLEQKIDKVFAPQDKDMYSVHEALNLLGISRSKFDRYKKDGQIKTTFLGRQVKVSKTEIDRIKLEGFRIR